MDAVFVEGEPISRERLRELQQRRDGPSVRRFLAQILLYLGSAVGLVLAKDPVLLASLIVVNAVVQFGMFGMFHEAGHKSAFTRPWANIAVGWFAALAQPMSPALFRAFHFQHHRHTHEHELDSELGGLELMARWPRGLLWLGFMTGLPILGARFGWMIFAALIPRVFDRLWRRVLPFVKAERRQRIAWEARVLLAIHGGALAAGVLVLPGILWVYAALVLAHAILAFYITCEHRGLPEQGSVLDRTRSLITPAWLRWLLWNMPYHAEHHGWPAVPWHALPLLHDEVREHLVHRERPLWLHLHAGRSRG